MAKWRAIVSVNKKSHRIPSIGLAYFGWNSWLILERVEASFCLDFFVLFYQEKRTKNITLCF
ncbi:MAG: hypothetical protein A2041_14725 [Bacteroidetes bacterium GWA2_31_9b]|nr:MAG: hypothetical protein A2041_14725 [Bacteroidetes bacterium GWA2_31_9b]